MKVIATKPEFSPITITLETEEEANIIFALARQTEGTGPGFDLLDDIYDGLLELGIRFHHEYFLPVQAIEVEDK